MEIWNSCRFQNIPPPHIMLLEEIISYHTCLNFNGQESSSIFQNNSRGGESRLKGMFNYVRQIRLADYVISSSWSNDFWFKKRHPQIPGGPQKSIPLFGVSGDLGCLQNSYIDIFFYFKWKLWQFLTNTLKDFIVIFVIV